MESRERYSAEPANNQFCPAIANDLNSWYYLRAFFCIYLRVNYVAAVEIKLSSEAQGMTKLITIFPKAASKTTIQIFIQRPNVLKICITNGGPFTETLHTMTKIIRKFVDMNYFKVHFT